MFPVRYVVVPAVAAAAAAGLSIITASLPGEEKSRASPESPEILPSKSGSLHDNGNGVVRRIRARCFCIT